MESINTDLTTNELIEAGYDPAKAVRVEALQERARRFGGRVRVQRQSPATGKEPYAYVVDLDPRGHLRLNQEPVVAYHMLEEAEQQVAALEQKYGES